MTRTLAFATFAAYAAIQGALSLWGFWHDAARRDFGQFVSSAASWQARGVLYEQVPRVNLNPPHASILLFSPLTWMPFDAAVTLWLILQLFSVFIAIALIQRELKLPAQRLEWIVAATVASAMTVHNWIEGQVGWILLAGGAAAWRAARQPRRNRASLLAAALVNVKPQLVVMMFGFERRLLLRCAAWAVAIAAAGFAATGLAPWFSWIDMTRAQGLQLRPWNVSIAPVLYRFGLAMPVLYLHVALAALLAGITLWSTRTDPDVDRRWVLWGTAMLLVSPVSWVYYAGAFLGPLIAWGEQHRWPLLACAGIALWLVPLQLVASAGSLPPSWRTGILSSVYTWGALMVWASALSGNRHRAR